MQSLILGKWTKFFRKYGYEPSSIIPILQDIQAKYRYLPKEVFSYLSEKTWHQYSENIQCSYFL